MASKGQAREQEKDKQGISKVSVGYQSNVSQKLVNSKLNVSKKIEQKRKERGYPGYFVKEFVEASKKLNVPLKGIQYWTVVELEGRFKLKDR
jgi:hypothetical protein